MLISINWLRDFVDIPTDADIEALAERFTLNCAEVEGVERVTLAARGLVAARITSTSPLEGLTRVTLDIGAGEVQAVSAAPGLKVDDLVVFAPVGAHTARTGTINASTVAGHPSEGMILPGDAVGIGLAPDQAVFCPPSIAPGENVDELVRDDWLIEVDNKSITHRPDLWGHYGIAREVAAILRLPLKPYPVTPLDELQQANLPAIPIEIDDPDRCRRYSGLRITGVKFQPAPLWMQVRLGLVGMRPIDCLVDLSNYIMAEMGQPTHAFDGDKLTQIEVGFAEAGSTFTTLDGVERKLPPESLMILAQRKPVALAGIMGGAETEVSAETQSILLESANFEAAGIRRCATALGLRTDASARFEKSLDPENTVLAIQRFIKLAQPEFPALALASNLSDAYPNKLPDITVTIDPQHVRRTMGHPVNDDEINRILTALAFHVEQRDGILEIGVPSFRATKDIAIEADVIEEIARCVGYDNIDAALPDVSVRHYPPNPQHRIERDTLQTFTLNLGYHEVHLYCWYNETWMRKLGCKKAPGIALRNPASAGQEIMRHALMPGLLAAADRNRLHSDTFRLCEIGTVWPADAKATTQSRRIGLVHARRGKKAEDTLFAELKGDLEAWSLETLGRSLNFTLPKEPQLPDWAHPGKTADILLGETRVGTVSVVPLDLRRRIDEHLAAWGIAWAEIDLDPLQTLTEPDCRLLPVPAFPEVDLDFSLLVPATSGYGAVNQSLAAFDHDLLRRISFVTAFEGKAIPEGKRSLTYRLRLGAADRTLVDTDLAGLRAAFEAHIASCGFELRS